MGGSRPAPALRRRAACLFPGRGFPAPPARAAAAFLMRHGRQRGGRAAQTPAAPLCRPGAARLPWFLLGTRSGSARAGSRASRRTSRTSTRLPREHRPAPSRGESAAQLKLTAEPAQPRAQTRFAPSARAAHGATRHRRLAEHKPLGLKLQNRAIYLEFWGCLCISAYSGWVLTAMAETE